jgi:5-methylcytosine-specific restriction endonuclease McrA
MSLNDELHSKALAAARNFKEAERTLQEILCQIDRHKTYYDLGYRSLMDYTISALGLSPDVAYNHCTAVKKSQELPEVRKAISEGKVSVSAVRHMAPVLSKENETEMLGLASQMTQAELRKEIAKRNPEQDVPEKARYVREDRVALELRVSEELMKKLRRAQDLVAQSKREFVSLEQTLEAMVEVFLEKKDPVKKAERTVKRCEESSQALPLNDRMIRKTEANVSGSRRITLPASLKHALIARTEGRCMVNAPNGARCTQTRWLHIHHVTPLSEGGGHSLENLTVLCSGHHRMTHRKMKGSRLFVSGEG